MTGPHPQSDRGNLWILTCMDSFTKWAEAFPLRSKEAEPIARILVEQLFTRFGPPLSILSDLGREVDGKIMNEVCKLFGIEKLRTTAYKPSTNQVERFHKTMNSILAKTVAEHQHDWDARLPYAMAAYRATQHDSTGYSPNMLVLGRETRAPPDIIYGAAMESSEQDYDRFVEQTRDRATQAYYDVRVSLQKRAQRNKKYYDLGLKGADFNAGDWVLYFNPRKLRGKQMKWVRQYEGPFLIIAKPTKLTARIQRSTRAQSQVVHVDKLKKFVGKTPKAWRIPDVNEQAEQSVERGIHLAGSPRDLDSSGAIRVGAENLGLPVGAIDSSVGMSGVDPFSSTPRAPDSYTDPHVEDRHDGAQSVFARQKVRAEVHNELGFDPPNGQVESEVCQYMGSKQLNEQPELYSSSEQLIEQPELSLASEQGVGQVGISPTAGEQRCSFASESNDLVRGEVSGSTFASQQELAACCSGQDCPLQAVNVAMGTPKRSFPDVTGNDFSRSSYGLDTEIGRSPISEQSLAGSFSILNYPAERVDAQRNDTDDDMTITRSDLYADDVPQRARTRPCFDNPNNFPSQRPSRTIRRPAWYDDFQTQFTQSQHVRKIKCTLSSSRSRARCKHASNKEVTFKRCRSDLWQQQRCRVPAVAWGYKSSPGRHFSHYESGGEAVNIGAPIPSNLIIDKTSKASNIHKASKSSSSLGTINSIRTCRVDKRVELAR